MKGATTSAQRAKALTPITLFSVCRGALGLGELKTKNSKPFFVCQFLSTPLDFVKIGEESSPQRSLFILYEESKLMVVGHLCLPKKYMDYNTECPLEPWGY